MCVHKIQLYLVSVTSASVDVCKAMCESVRHSKPGGVLCGVEGWNAACVYSTSHHTPYTIHPYMYILIL